MSHIDSAILKKILVDHQHDGGAWVKLYGNHLDLEIQTNLTDDEAERIQSLTQRELRSD